MGKEKSKQCECGSDLVNTTNKDNPFCFHCGKPLTQKEPKQDYSRVHLAHCYQGEYEDGCKYGEDNCPAKPLESKQETLEDDIQTTAIRFLEWYRRKNIFFQFHRYHIPSPGDKNWEQTVFYGDNSYLTSRELFAIFKKEVYE